MSWAPTEVQKAVYTALVNDPSLILLIGANSVYDHVPDNTSYPYVTINLLPFEDRGSHTTEGFDGEIQVSVWDQKRGKKSVQVIQACINGLLHKANLSITGQTIVSLRRTMVDILRDPDNVTLQGVQRFRILTGDV